MAFKERPPRGYDRQDDPLYHETRTKFSLNLENDAKNSTIIPFLRTSIDSADPSIIEVNPLNSAYEVDGGPLICYDSQVVMMNHVLRFSMATVSRTTDNIQSLYVNYMPIFGSFKENWEATDKTTGDTILSILDLTSDATNEDIIPAYSGTDLANTSNLPVSTVTPAGSVDEVFGDYDLTTDLIPESTPFVEETYWDAIQRYTNGNKLKTLTGRWRTVKLTDHKGNVNIKLPTTVPRHVQFGNPYLFYGCLVHLRQSGAFGQIPLATETTNLAHVHVQYESRWAEWNRDFNQKRM